MHRPVLFRVTNNVGIGGVERRLLNLLPHLTDAFEVHLVTYNGQGVLWDEFRDQGVSMHYAPLRGKWDPAGLRRLAALFREHGADIVHGHSLGGNISGILAGALAGVPVRCGNVHQIVNHWYARPGLHRRKQVLEEVLVHRLFTQKIFVGSQETLDFYQRATGLPRTKLHLLREGLDFAHMRPVRTREAVRQELGLSGADTVVGLVGRLVPGKGVDFFVEFATSVLARNGSYRFVIVGDGGERTRWEEETRRRGLSGRLVFAGERTDVYDYFNIFDCFLFTSPPASEGSTPGALTEACHFGLPVISRELLCVREVAASYPRILFMDEDADPLETLEAALALPPADPGPFREEFGIATMARRITGVYADLLEARRR